jgi:hypothetical protein
MVDLARALESAKQSLTQALAPLEDDDMVIARDVGMIFINNCGDPDYEVEGLAGPSYAPPGFQVRHGSGQDVYTLIVTNRPEISFRQIATKVMKHESVYDVIVDNDARNGGTPNLTVQILIWKSRMSKQPPRKHEPKTTLTVDDNMNGLVMNKASKEDARGIIESVINMDGADMWEPNWEDNVARDGTSFTLTAKPVRRVYLSFYTYLCALVPTVQNVVLGREFTDKTVRCMSMTIYCNMREDKDGGEDEDDEEEEEEVVRKRSKAGKTKQKSQGIKALPIAKKKVGNAKKSFFRKLGERLNILKRD